MKLIASEKELDIALERINEIWGAQPNTNEADELEILSLLVQHYEDEHYPIPSSSPIETIKFLMEQNSLSREDLGPFIGSPGRVSEILNGKRDLSLNMIKKLHHKFHVPYELLIAS